MTGQAKLNAGDTAWTEQGQRVTIIDLTVSGAYLAAPMIEYGGSYDEPPVCEMGELQITEKLYSEPPRPLLDAEIAKTKQELEGLRDQLGDVRSEIREALAERTRLITKLKDVPSLRYIEAAVESRFTHIVSCSYGPPYTIGTIEEALDKNDRFSKGLKLLTLYGDAKGNLQWRINHYSDGSGGATDAWPFTSEDDALAFLRQKIADDIEYHCGGHSDSREHYLVALCMQGRKFGVSIPDKALVLERAQAHKIAASKLEEARKGVEQAQQRLAVAEAQAKELLQ